MRVHLVSVWHPPWLLCCPTQSCQANLDMAVWLAKNHPAVQPANPLDQPQPVVENWPVPAPRRRFPSSTITLLVMEQPPQQPVSLSPHRFQQLSCPQLTGSRANAEAGMLGVWAARTLTLGMPTDGCGVAVPCCWPSNTFPRSKRDMQCQGASVYTPGSGGLGL